MKNLIKLAKLPPVELPENKNGLYITGQIHKIKSQKILEIDIYEDGKLNYRYFIDRKDYAYIKAAKDGEKLISGKAHISHLLGYWCSNEYVNAAKSAFKEFGFKSAKIYEIERLEYEIEHVKTLTAIERKKIRIKSRLKNTPPLPKDFRSFCCKHGGLNEKYAFKSGDKYYCAECGKDFSGDYKDRQKITCPICKEKVTVLTRAKKIRKVTYFQLIQQFEGGYMDREFQSSIGCSISCYNNTVTVHKTRRMLTEQVRGIGQKGFSSWFEWYYGIYQDVTGSRQEFWNKKGGTYVNRCPDKMILYMSDYIKENYPSSIVNTIEQLQKNGIKGSWILFIGELEKKPYLEYLYKAGLYKLAGNIQGSLNPSAYIDLNASKLKDLLQIDGQRVNRLKEINGGVCALQLLQYEEQHGEKIAKETLIKLNNIYTLNEISRIKEIVGLSWNSLCNFLSKSGKNIEATSRTYRDYIDLAMQRNMNIRDDIVRKNKRFIEYHNRWNIENAERRDREADKKRIRKYIAIKKDFNKNNSRFSWKDKEFTITPAKDAAEIIKEGRELHHCVGASDRYMNKMVRGESFICFLRKNDQPDVPYYTLEVDKDMKLLQAYSAYDRQPDWEEINKVIKKYLKDIQKRALTTEKATA
nr:MAG TPA: PcfJ like protein [Caudoviricetes sp.]